MKLAVIGCGYVGLVSGSCLAEAGHDVVATDNDALRIATLQAGKIPIYEPNLDKVLASVVRDFARELHFDVSEAEAAGLPESIRNWQPFPDTVAGLRRLHSRYKLAILSNIDDDLFAWSAAKLDVPFDCVVTAQQVRSYKPSLRNFEMLLERLAIPRDRLLHVAESLYHDVGAAGSLGIATVWVNRRQGKTSAATKLTDARPNMEVSTVGKLADLAGC